MYSKPDKIIITEIRYTSSKKNFFNMPSLKISFIINKNNKNNIISVEIHIGIKKKKTLTLKHRSKTKI